MDIDRGEKYRCRAVTAVVRVFALVALVCAAVGPSAASESDAWEALDAGGHVVFLRHALAPGTGDPPNLRLGDCTTQRNLSDAGREQARRIGAGLRAAGVAVDAVYSSAWCRCMETAELLGLAPVLPFQPLNSFFNRPAQREAQLARLRPWVAAARPQGTILLVTHQVVITAMTGVFPRSGEMVVVRPGDKETLQVVGRILPMAAAPPTADE